MAPESLPHPDDSTAVRPPAESRPDEGNATDAATGTRSRPKPARPATDRLPPWQVILHNDDVNEIHYVIETVQMLTPLKRPEAIRRTLEAHFRGRSLLLTTHRERAELYKQQFASRKLTVTIHKT